jgi:hypothetical protein
MYVLVFLISFLFSVLFFNIGGSLAEVTNSSGTFLGFGFKAGGAIAGFVIIVAVSIKVIDHFATAVPATPFDIRLKVKGANLPFKQLDTYVADASISREGKDNIFPVQPRWDYGYLAIDLTQVLPDDKIAVVIKNREDDARQWQVSQFLLKEPLQDARFVGLPVQGRRDTEVAQGPTGGRSMQVEQKTTGGGGPRATTGGRRAGVGPIAHDATGTPKK